MHNPGKPCTDFKLSAPKYIYLSVPCSELCEVPVDTHCASCTVEPAENDTPSPAPGSALNPRVACPPVAAQTPGQPGAGMGGFQGLAAPCRGHGLLSRAMESHWRLLKGTASMGEL